MHDTAMAAGTGFAEIYGRGGTVVDVGGLNVNGSLREAFTSRGMKFVAVDIQAHPSVDIVVKPGDPLPFATGSVDASVSTSCFEHDPCFWITFREMCRIVRPGGYVYVNAPAQGVYHKYPGDNWRLYPDAAAALAFWAGREGLPVAIAETFTVLPKSDAWTDFVAVWQRVAEPTSEIVVSDEVKNRVGPLREAMHRAGFRTWRGQ